MAQPAVQRGALVAQAGSGCLSPQSGLHRLLCFDTARAPGPEGEDELPFYLAAPEALQDLVRQGELPCPALWVDVGAAAGGTAHLRVLFRLGGGVQHCALPGKPLRLQPVKQAGGGSARGGGSSSSATGTAAGPAFRAFVSTRRHTQLYRLVVGLFPKLEQLHQELQSGAVALRGGAGSFEAAPTSPGSVTATPMPQGVSLQRVNSNREEEQLTVAVDLEHACLVLRDVPAAGGAEPRCLRTVNCLAEALAVLHRESGRLGPSLAASPVKPAGAGGAGAAGSPGVPSPAKPPLPAAHGTEALRLAVQLVQACSSAQLREGLAILSAAAGSGHLCAAAIGFGALEALVTAAATVLPSPSMGMSELQPSLAVAVTSLLDAAPPSAYAAGRLVSIMSAVLQQACANPLLLCRLLVAVLQRADVRAEAMRQGLASTIADVYVRLSPAAQAAAAELFPPPQQQEQEQQRRSTPPAAEAAAASPGGSGSMQPPPQDAQSSPLGFGSPLLPGAAAAENEASAGNGRGRQSKVANLVAAYNALSDSGSDCSASSSRSPSPIKVSPSPLRSPSVLSQRSSRLSVPRLALPTADSPTAAAAAGGLTRSTRRALSRTPGGTRSPSPFGSPTRRSGTIDSAEPGPLAELATLASALGESLMAADLPAILAHKRRADVQLADAEEAEEGAPADLLEPPPGTAKKVLEAHRILVTARSLRSVDSSATHTTDTEPAAGAAAAAAASARAMVDVEQIKCLLLRALVAALPLLEPTGWPARNPSPVLAVEVVGLLGTSQEQLKQLRQLAVQALQRLAQRPVAPMPADSSSRGGCDDGSETHALVAAAGGRLDALACEGAPEGEARTELLALLQLLAEYAAAVPQPAVAVAIVRHCLRGFQALFGVLQAGGLDAPLWPASAWQLLQSLVPLLAATCRRCEDADAGRGLLALLLGDQQVASMLAGAASHVLLLPEQQEHEPAPAAGKAGKAGKAGTPANTANIAQRSRMAALQRDLLQLFAALAALAGRQPPCVPPPHEPERAASRISMASSVGLDDLTTGRDGRDGDQAGPGQDLLLGASVRRGLTRRRALQFFGFLVSPHSGLVQRVLDHDPAVAVQPSAGGKGKAAKAPQAPPLGTPCTPASAAAVRLRQSLLELLKAVFSAPGSPFAADKFVSDFYIRFHFVQFLKLYHNPQRDHQALFLCRQHMDLLLALAANTAPHIRHRFNQLSVVDFFVRELSLEFEAKQPARGRMHRLSSAGSQLGHRRTSSSSTIGGAESGTASPALSLRLPTVHEPEPQRSPANVPLLRLPTRGSGAVGSGNSSPALHLPAAAGGGSGGRSSGVVGAGGRGMAVPRLNLGGAPSLPSPGGQSTPSPGNSARQGRPPLPPSARSGMGATPRLTSRLGRTVSARSAEGGFQPAGPPAPPPAPPAQQQQQQQQQPMAKPVIPKLGLAGVGRGLAVSAAAGAAAWEQQAAHAAAAAERPPERAHSRVHFSPTPPRLDPSDSDSSSSDSEDERGPGAATPPSAAATGTGSASGRPTPMLGLDVPAGFTFSGDLEEDLERLEALELGEGGISELGEPYESDSEETASPTIPALRASPFSAPAAPVAPPVPPLTKALLGLSPAPSGEAPPLALHAQQEQQQQQGVGAAPVPRLALTHSMHSNLESRNATAELQLAADAEVAKARQGRGVLGELERSALGKGKVQAASVRKMASSLSDVAGSMAAELSYSEERGRRLLYQDEGLHLEVLQLVFTLIFDADGQLDCTYCDQYPWERKLQNIPYVLYHHLNHEENRPLLPHLLPRLAGGGGRAAPALRLLRLLCAAFFRPEWYTGRARVSNAVGAYSTIYRATLPPWAGEGSVILKLVDTPPHIQDRCAQVEVVGEVAILEALVGSPRACQLYDYGVDPAADAMFLVLKDYRCSLRQWRARQPSSPAGQLRLYYAIFAEVAAAVQALLDRGIVHFDLKCDNCLLEPLPGVGEAEFWGPSSERPPFRVVLADFGESRAFSSGVDGAATCRARGTDCFKSPEMLMMGGASHNPSQSAYDRRRRQGAGAASDVWSLGCLLYELVTGKLLFTDSDWLQLVARVTGPSMPLITEERAERVAGLPGMLDLLHFMLVRDARMRPTLADVQARLAAVRSSSRARLPPHAPASAVQHSARGTPASAGGLQHSGSSQMFSPTSYVPSPKASMPMPLLAALPLSPQLVLAPLALLGSAAALRQHPAARVVLLFSPGAGGAEAGHRSKAQRAAEAATAGGGGLSPASPASVSSASSSWDSSPTASRRYYSGGATPAGDYTSYTPNPVFGAGSSATASPSTATAPSTVGARHHSARALSLGTPRTALRFGSAAVHPEPAGSPAAAASPIAAAAAGGGSPAPRLLASNRVHPESPALQPQAQGLQLALPPQPSSATAPAPAPAPAPAASAYSTPTTSSRRSAQDALLQTVLADAELSAAAASCAAAGVECRLAAVRPGGGERGLQQPLALHRWLSEVALPLLAGPSSSQQQQQQQQQQPVLLAVQAGCEPEAAMAAVAHLMRERQASLYQAMVAASQWGIDLHLRQPHVMALQYAGEGAAAGGGGGGSWLGGSA